MTGGFSLIFCFLSVNPPAIDLDPALMAQQPEQSEVGIEFTFENPFQVKFNIGGAGEAHVIAQNSEA